MKPKLKPPGTERLKLKCDMLLSTSAFTTNLRHYNSAFVSGGDVFGTGTSAGGGSALGREVQVDTIKTCVESAYGLSA